MGCATRRKSAAGFRPSKNFACSAALVLAADVFDQYLCDIAEEDWLSFEKYTREIAAKEITRPKDEGGNYSISERAEALLKELGQESTEPLLAALDLFSKWRNAVVHSSIRKPKLKTQFRKILINSKKHFHEHYSHLDIELAIQNFEHKKTPVPKETTSLIAAAQNASKMIDEAAIQRVAGTPELMEVATERILLNHFADPDHLQFVYAEICEAWQG